MILLIDNYDSFVHNLARYLNELGVQQQTLRNDAASVEAIIMMKPEAIMISPGPCTPKEAGVSVALVRAAAQAHIPLLGVCLGHQAIAEAFGGKTIRAAAPRHGKTSPIGHQAHALFAGLANPFAATRYHSLVADLETAPDLVALAHAADDRQLMALAHKNLPIYGVQFHPESILTENGHMLLANFLDLARIAHDPVPKNLERAS